MSWTRGLVLAMLTALGLATAGSAQDSKSESPPAGQQPSGQQRPKRVRVAEGVAKALLVKKVEPDYPQEARDKRIEGTVVLQVEISDAGTSKMLN